MRRLNFKLLNLIFVILFLMTISVYAEEDQWPSLRGDNSGKGSVVYNGSDSIREWHFNNQKTRRYKPGMSVWASPAIAIVGSRPVAYVGGYDQTLHALDLVEKKELWSKLTNGTIDSAPVIGKVDGVDVVFFSSSDRTIYAHKAFNGQRLWTRELVEATSTLGDSRLSSPLVFDDKIFVACFVYDKALPTNNQKGFLFCLNKFNGNIIWKMVVSNGFLSSPQSYNLGEKKFVAIAARKGLLQSFDVGSRKPSKVWEYQMPHEVMGSPVVLQKEDSATIFLGSKYGNIVAINGANGQKIWQRMAGNWIDNTVSIGTIDEKDIVFTGSHDYKMYAFDAKSGDVLWSKALGGEIYSAPSFVEINGKPAVIAASLDNHLYMLDARSGEVITSFYTGAPMWDKISKGENIWGSPSALSAGNNSVVVHGSYNGIIYVLPLSKPSSLKAMARSSSSLWIWLGIVFFVFVFIVLPVVIKLPVTKET